MVAVALVGPFPIRLSAGNLTEHTHSGKKHFENCIIELADT